MSCCFISPFTVLRRSTSFLISLGRIPNSRLESGISGISSCSSSCYHRNNMVSLRWHFVERCQINVGTHTHTPHSSSASVAPVSAQWWSRYWTPGWLTGTGCWSRAAAQTCHKNLEKKTIRDVSNTDKWDKIETNKKKKIQTYQLWDPTLNLQRRRPFSSACLSPPPPPLLLQPEDKQQVIGGGGFADRRHAWLHFYHFQLGLFERRLIRNNVVFLVEGVKQEELVPLGATAHQSPGLRRRSRRGGVMIRRIKKNPNLIWRKQTVRPWCCQRCWWSAGPEAARSAHTSSAGSA